MKKLPIIGVIAGTLQLVSMAAIAAPLTVYKSPWCGCCTEWVEAAEKAGHQVSVHDMEDLSQIKSTARIPDEMASCHTASLEAGDRTYVVEGHVPMEALERLVTEQPDIRGVAVPGMPMGSVGMGSDPSARYDVHILGGKGEVFMSMGE